MQYRFIALSFLMSLSLALSAADLSVTRMELISSGQMEDDYFVLDTFGDIDIDVTGGYKLGGGLTLGITSDFIDDEDAALISDGPG